MRDLILRFGRIVAVLAAAVLLPGNFVAQTATVKYSLDTPINDQYTNACNGEQVQVTGTNHFEYFFQTRADGGINFFQHSETHVKGVGLTTNVGYIGDNVMDISTRTNGGQASDSTNTEKLKLVAQGPTPNMTVTTSLHTVVDAQGNIKVERSKATSTCK